MCHRDQSGCIYILRDIVFTGGGVFVKVGCILVVLYGAVRWAVWEGWLPPVFFGVAAMLWRVLFPAMAVALWAAHGLLRLHNRSI